MFKLSLDQVLQLRQKSENSEIFMPLLLMFLEMFIYGKSSIRILSFDLKNHAP